MSLQRKPEVGEEWAYRKRAIDPLERVVYLKHRSEIAKKPKYSLVRFESPEAEGLEEWVPDGRLKCLWPEADAFASRERRWEAVAKASYVDDGLELAIDAVMTISELDAFASAETKMGQYAFEISDLEAVSTFGEIGVEELISDPTSFEENGHWIIPLAPGLPIVKKLAAINAYELIRDVEREEQKFEDDERRDRQLYPRYEKGRQEKESNEAMLRSFRLRREWAGEDNNWLRRDALTAEAEVERLRDLVEWAIKKLEGYGHKPSAATLRKNLDP